ncbi:hypothetical protein LSTR_LSTR001983 [Laodelphax striatellus]|uniref:Prefoldin subunit 5 n=1 Tax=Laodelphax striatellus TaxID=195883 RepID=A0A482XGZ1_LAOST|nr:hypothetical protein LSTR_LSTR001983 [Laodelphax striatellus]
MEEKKIQLDFQTYQEIENLTAVKDQSEKDLKTLQSSMEYLDIAQKKLTGSQHVLEKVTPEMNGKEILVPLTGSMYVYGKIADSDNVLIDVGAAYYVQKDVNSAIDYFKRKSIFVNEQMMKVEKYIVTAETKQRETEMKLQEIFENKLSVKQ